jgi:plastocyanin
MPRRVAILIANGTFADPELDNLRGPTNDVRRLAAVLRDAHRGRFDVVEEFIDKAHYEIAKHVDDLLSNEVGSDDLALVYYSGHGKLDPKGQLYLATSNTYVRTLPTTSLPLANLKAVVDGSRSTQIVLLLDCCFSGAAGKAFLRGGAVADALIQEPPSGLFLMTSSTSKQTSSERESDTGPEVLGNFTRCLVEGLETGDADQNPSDGVITLEKLWRYLEHRLKGQRPKYWTFGRSGDPTIAWTQAQRREAAIRSALNKLGEWHRSGNVSLEFFTNAVRLLKRPLTPLDETLGNLVIHICNNPEMSAEDLVDSWNATSGISVTGTTLQKPVPQSNVVTRPWWKRNTKALLLISGVVIAALVGKLFVLKNSVLADGASGGPAPPTTLHVLMTGDGSYYSYSPSNFTIRSGDAVRFYNRSGGPHNVSFWSDSIPVGAASVLKKNMPNQMAPLEGPLLTEPDAVYEVSFADAPKGDYKFYCLPHLALGMRGILRVE